MKHTAKPSKNSGAIAKKKKGFNFIDFLLILLVLALIAGAVYLFSPASFLRQLSTEKTGTLSYTVEIVGVDEDYLNLINEEDAVGDASTKAVLGTVRAVDYSIKQTELGYTQTENGYVGELNEYGDRYNVLVTVEAEAQYVPGRGYYIDGTRIAVGEAVSLRFPDYSCQGYCVSLAAEDFQ